MRRILFILKIFIISLFIFTQSILAADFRITSANYDISNSMIVLGAKDTIDGTIAENIVLKKLENPTRYYFDIDTTVLTIPKQDWVFQTGDIERVTISQFQVSPNIVRVVFYPKDDAILKNLKFYRLKNSIVMRLNKNEIQNNYYQHIYRDEHSSAGDFYENLKVVYTPPITTVEGQAEQEISAPKEDFRKFKLNTKYYLNNVSTKSNSILLGGFGEMTFEKPMILQNPTRLIYDFPNAVADQDLRNQTFKINETDKVVIGQFSLNKVRAVIYTENPNDYVPVISSDNQSVLFINQRVYNPSVLSTPISRISQYDVQEVNNLTQTMTLSFNAPVIHSVNRETSALSMTLYNVQNFSEEAFKMKFSGSFFGNAKIIKLANGVGVRIYLPLRSDSQVNTYLGADGKAIKVVLKETERSKNALYNIPQVTTVARPGNGGKIIIIDAGHGGTDYGAIREGVNEKDIVLDVAKRVQKDLTKRGHKVVMTRVDDVFIPLADRVEVANGEMADIFLSIHVNSSVKPEIEGVETHYYRQESMELAQAVHESLISNLKPFDRGLFKSKFYVINHTEMPAILCEIGFISNEKERKLLVTDKRKEETARAIVDGVLKYFGQVR